MAKKNNPKTFQTQAIEHTDEEALRIAKATQTPGQTKEQTKVISKGIAKGIAQYKKQEKAKLRERNKVQRKSNHASAVNKPTHQSTESIDEREVSANPGNLPSRIAAGLFGLTGLLHVVRYLTNTRIIIDTFTVPISWSIPAAIIMLILSAWIFRHS